MMSLVEFAVPSATVASFSMCRILLCGSGGGNVGNKNASVGNGAGNRFMEFDRRQLFGWQQRQLGVGWENIDGGIVEFRTGLQVLGSGGYHALIRRDWKLRSKFRAIQNLAR